MHMLTITPQPTNNNRPSFNGLTKSIGKRIYVDGKKNVLEFLEKRDCQVVQEGNHIKVCYNHPYINHTHMNTQVGELPPCIFYRLPKDDRPNRIKEIFKVFSECANEIRDFKPALNAPIEERANRRPNTAVEKMRDVLTKHGVLDKPEEFDLQYLGAGEYKKAYLMKGLRDEKTGDRVCYKVFHVVDTSPEWHKYKCHGNYSELNIATYWKKNEGNHTHLNKFYAGDINNGYLMDRFIDHEVPETKRYVDVYDYGVRNIDAVQGAVGHNKLNGYSIDEGGSRVVNIVKNQSKIARYVLRRIKAAPEDYRFVEWHKILRRKDLDETQKQAGLALSLKHFPNKDQTRLIKECLGFNKPLVDQALGYALKYLPEEQATQHFETLMQRGNDTTQTVLMNEIPLLAKEGMRNKKYDDINVPRAAVNPDIVAKYYDISKKYVNSSVEEHLASYVHLLPTKRIIPEAKALIDRDNYHILDRLLHKIRFISTDEYSFGDKMELIAYVQEKGGKYDFINQKAKETRVKVLRDTLSDD